MIDNLSLIDRIYEASVMTERWPALLQDIADLVGAKGSMFMARSPYRPVWSVASPGIMAHVDEYVAQGWAANPAHVAPLFAEQWPGFRTETDYRTAEEVAALPVHAAFLDPRGYIAGNASVIQGANDDALHISFEGFASHGLARRALAPLDALRPHLARAISLTVLRTDRSRVVVDSLALIGAPAAVIGLDGRMRAANAPFVARMSERMIETLSGLRFTDRFLMRQVAQALERHRHDRGRVQSVAVHGDDPVKNFAIHLLPIVGAARELCDADGVLMLIAEPANISIPSADLLRLLFDITPAEARVARSVVEGQTVADIATRLMVSEATVRQQLKSVFVKTGVSRQAELVGMMAGLGVPRV